MDGLSIATAVVTFGELAKSIKESIEKVGENKKNLADLQRQVEDTVQELEKLAQGHGSNVLTRELLTALNNLTAQLKTVNTNCQALARTQATGLPGFVKSWFKREKIEAEIKQMKDNRKDCCAQFQLLSLTRVEGHAARTEGTTARTEGHAVIIETTTARTEGHTIRIEAATARTEGHAAQTEISTAQLVTLARKEELQKWFQAIDMREKQRATHALRHSDTGRWFLEDTKFAKWKEQPGCLWLRGNSGTGKSVLSSIAIDHLFDYRPVKVANSHPATLNFGIAYFYFDFRDEKKQLLENMLRSIIMQLSEQSPTPYSVLDQHFKSCQGGKFPTHDDLVAMLDTIFAEFAGTYIVLDALDECNEHDRLVQFLATLRGWVKPVHLLVASQPRTLFLESPAFKKTSVVFLEPDAMHADILQFVNSELKLSKLSHLSRFAEEIAPKIVDKSNGMFRLAACLLQELTHAPRVNPKLNKILSILNKLPNDLWGIYARFLEPIGKDDFVYVITLLRWVAFSARPVTMLELTDALAINADQWVFEPEERGSVGAVCDLLEGLVVAGPDTFRPWAETELVVTLAHSSVKDYIVSGKFLEQHKEDLKEAPSHTFLAQSCVTYLLHFEHNPLNANTLPKYPLAQYAAQFWSHHLLRCHDRGVLRCSTMRLLQHRSKQYVAMNCLYNICEPWNNTDWSRHAPWPLYLCSLIGYIEGVEILLEKGANVKAASGIYGIYGNALQAAALHGHVHTVHLLLDRGADVNTLSVGYDSALQGAAASGHMDIVRVLLERGADVNAVGGEYGSALQCAARYGYVDVARILLDRGANVNTAGGKYGSALQGAAWKGHVDTVCVLLEKGADVNAAGGIYGSVLQGAVSGRHMDIVCILLEKGADVNTAGGKYGSVLQGVAWKGHVDTVCVLLEKGADVNAAGGIYGSALQGAVSGRHMDIVCILLEKGADVNTAGGIYGSALQAAAWYGYVDIARTLLDRGADVNAAGGEYSSALQAAAFENHMDIVRLLLGKGADANTAGGRYGSALQGAASKGHMDIVRILLEHGADVNAAGGEHGSALQCAASTWISYVDLVHLLLEKGADVNTAGGKYGSALQGAAWYGQMDIVRLLLEHGADVNATGREYGSALAAAFAEGHEEIAKLLCEHGALDVAPGESE
ncbi:ankyrin repeat-containing domain protein [Mycena polygramma]|nr:ankyrin repeat-containing domain protein [Mycena polygramma]